MATLFSLPDYKPIFVREIKALVNVLKNRLLSSFENIDQEASDIENKKWKEFSSGVSFDADPANLAEKAMEEGLEHYLLMTDLRQGMINLFATTLYHLFEQQISIILNREVPYCCPNWEKPKQLSLDEIKCQFKKFFGIDVAKFKSWQKLHELCLVANSVKHAQGNSSDKLYKIRLDLFINPMIENSSHDPPTLNEIYNFPTGFQPLTGNGLYVSIDDIKIYRDILVSFWEELSV